jgi:hypothetical protein
MATIPTNPDALLRRVQTAEALTAAGYPTAAATLATMATRGGGPPYQLYGRIPVYRWGSSLAWAEGRLSKPVRSTAEADLARDQQRVRHRHDDSQAPQAA